MKYSGGGSHSRVGFGVVLWGMARYEWRVLFLKVTVIKIFVIGAG
jgi:hypothetical protein